VQTEFCLLGPVAVRHGGIAVPLAHGKQRSVLASPLLSAGRMVSLGELAEALWVPGRRHPRMSVSAATCDCGCRKLVSPGQMLCRAQSCVRFRASRSRAAGRAMIFGVWA
jgi:DNA-binding SARP family transcriptional activator